jgi:Cdc6-like AAA superfamily ATPase
MTRKNQRVLDDYNLYKVEPMVTTPFVAGMVNPRDHFQRAIRMLTPNEQLLLYAIARVQARGTTRVTSGKVLEEYRQLLQKHRIRDVRNIQGHIPILEMTGLVGIDPNTGDLQIAIKEISLEAALEVLARVDYAGEYRRRLGI